MHTRTNRLSPSGALAAALALATGLRAQCTASWSSQIPGLTGEAYASTVWDPDGPGGVPTRIVIGGLFTAVAGIPASNIAAWDPATGNWSTFGAGLNGSVVSLAMLPSGDLIAGGVFTSAGGVSASYIARWDGAAWHPLGSGVNSDVYALKVLANGELAVGGNFTIAGGAAANRIAKWAPSSSTWSSLGTGGANGMNNNVRAIVQTSNGDIFAGGEFTSAGGTSALRVARWDGTVWNPLGGAGHGTNNHIYALALLPTGELVAGGYFTQTSSVPANYLAQWNGASWSSLGQTPNAYVRALHVDANGSLWIGGGFTAFSGFNSERVAVLSSGLWSGVGVNGFGPTDTVFTLASYQGVLAVGGSFATVGERRFASPGVAGYKLATDYFPLHGLSNSADIAALPNGHVAATGTFEMAFPGTSALGAGSLSGNSRIAEQDGTNWTSIGTTSVGGVYTVAATANSNILIGGDFAAVNGTPAAKIARWNGSTWLTFGSGLNGSVFALIEHPDGSVIAGGFFTTAGGVPASRVARWNGSSWVPLGAGLNDGVLALAVMPNGDIVASGWFTMSGGTPMNRVARWDGVSWNAMGSGMNDSVLALCVLDSARVVAGGYFSTAGGSSASCIASWNGAAWSPLGPGMSDGIIAYVNSVAKLPNGEIVAGGHFAFAGGAPVNNIARWNGASWSQLGGGLTGWPDTVNGGAYDVTSLPNGSLVVGGRFHAADGASTNYLATYSSSCPAIASQYGAGCSGVGGGSTLSATALPWVDATFRATGTGLPGTAIVVAATSVTPIPQGLVPLASVLSQGVPGCDLLVAPDILEVLVTLTGTTQSSLFLPNTPPLVGVTFYHQMIPIEVNAGGNWVAITSTNALRLTAGSF